MSVVFVSDLGDWKRAGLYRFTLNLARTPTTLLAHRGRGSSFACYSRPCPGLAACLLQEPLPLFERVVGVLLGPGGVEVGAQVGLLELFHLVHK